MPSGILTLGLLFFFTIWGTYFYFQTNLILLQKFTSRTECFREDFRSAGKITACWEAPDGSVCAAGDWLKIALHKKEKPWDNSGVYIGLAGSEYLNGKHFELEILNFNLNFN